MEDNTNHICGGVSEKRKSWILSWCSACKHFDGMEKGTCKAYPNGIPERFYYGSEEDLPPKHTEMEQDQTGSFTYVYHLE